jgi:Family of unknown function (DUF5808)
MKGRFLGAVPYDFERPTIQKLRQTWWDPGSDRILVPQAFGVGWTFNFAALKRRYPVAFWAVVALALWRTRRFLRLLRVL